MPAIEKREAFARFQKKGYNSSHFVWFIAEVKYFRSSNGWIFAYHQKGRVTLFALEPLPPEGVDYKSGAIAFHEAWEEVLREVAPKIVCFVSVYDEFLALLKKEGFQALHVGKEPYVDLADCVPTGKSGKGVRAARNQALRAGVTVKEYSGHEIQAVHNLVRDMKKIMHQWKSRNLMDMGEFLNKVNPFEYMEHRKYFLATSQKYGLEAFLVATPIPGKASYFLEDMVIRPGATRGTGELLTLETMVSLAEHNLQMASLGVVALTSVTESSAYKMPPLAKFVLVTVPSYLAKFYNVHGLEMFRKRFKPKVWENIYLAVKNYTPETVSDSRAWILSLTALLCSFKPRLNFTFSWLWQTIQRPLVKYPMSYGLTALFFISFFALNKGGELPEYILNNFGFTGSAPFVEWPLRSLASDILFDDLNHFAISTIVLFFLVRWMERSYTKKFVAWVIILTAFFDDFINHFVLIGPFSFFQPKVFEKLIAVKDVGPSLWIATFLGLQLCTLKKNRELLFTVLVLAFILSFIFNSARLVNVILNLNHTIFLVLGYIVGKFRFEYDRSISQKVAKKAPPVAKSVLVPAKKPDAISEEPEAMVEKDMTH